MRARLRPLVAPLVALISLLVPTAAAAHEWPPPSAAWWTFWSAEPAIAAPIALAAILYAAGVTRLWRAARIGVGVRVWEVVAYAAGQVVLTVALLSPLHPLGEVLFSAHMAQHELLMLVAAPLLVLGRPGFVFLWALPHGARAAVGGLLRWAPVRWTWRVVTLPLLAWAVHAVTVWVWHVPALFEATLDSAPLHALQHVTFLATALVFWWALVHHRGAMGYGAAVLYVFTTAIHTGLLGALLTFARTVWYPAYTATASQWGLSPLEDQQLGGLIMWVPGGLCYLIAGLALMLGWLQDAERAAAARTAARAAATLGLVLAAAVLPACERDVERRAAMVTSGDPHRGPALLRQYGCATCHTIPGVRGAAGVVGPPLDRIGVRVYLAGMLTNTPDNLIRWIRDPRGVDPRTVMPDLGVSEQDARDIAAYLYTLR